MSIYKKALTLHKQNRGKLEIKSKVKLTSHRNLSWAYTPGVAQVSREIYKNKKTAYDYTIKANTVAVVSDGSAILGIKETGALPALPVMEGKCAIFKEFADIDAFPICLDTHDTEEIIKATKLIAPAFGGINLEDIAAPQCFEIEARLRKELDIPVFHDDQHGTAIVVLAGLLNALKVVKKDLRKIKIVISGAGASGTATAKFLLYAGVKDLILTDSRGIIYSGRKQGMNPSKRDLAKKTNHNKIKGGLDAALKCADVFIGLSRPKVLKPHWIKLMDPDPIVFALANPEPEIMPLSAEKAGAHVVATGRSDLHNQLNNALAFPGLFRGALDARLKNISDKVQLKAAHALASLVPHPHSHRIVPDVFDKRIVPAIAKAISSS
ncbi:NADP-dependent malic enzyme [Candidatus Falkowbacteria bacterium]|nr:NADP-dependent malic enzyme [Candidatus Falkowbacteria bacterium]